MKNYAYIINKSSLTCSIDMLKTELLKKGFSCEFVHSIKDTDKNIILNLEGLPAIELNMLEEIVNKYTIDTVGVQDKFELDMIGGVRLLNNFLDASKRVREAISSQKSEAAYSNAEPLGLNMKNSIGSIRISDMLTTVNYKLIRDILTEFRNAGLPEPQISFIHGGMLVDCDNFTDEQKEIAITAIEKVNENNLSAFDGDRFAEIKFPKDNRVARGLNNKESVSKIFNENQKHDKPDGLAYKAKFIDPFSLDTNIKVNPIDCTADDFRNMGIEFFGEDVIEHLNLISNLNRKYTDACKEELEYGFSKLSSMRELESVGSKYGLSREQFESFNALLVKKVKQDMKDHALLKSLHTVGLIYGLSKEQFNDYLELLMELTE